ncbi:glycosyltransferase family 2 protein [Patescibacteria group bacterium]
MNKKHKNIETSLIILTRNEIQGVKATLDKIPFHTVDEYFAVDFKSTDGTVEYFHKNNIPVMKQIIPGRAEAFSIGAKKAQGKYLIFFSPDGNENPQDIPKLIALLKNGNDIAIASRFLPQSRNEEDDQLFKFRAWANQIFTLIVNMIWNGKLSDSINGYRAIRKSAYDTLRIDAKGFAVEFQMSIRALKQKMKIAEIPTIEGDRIGGQSTSTAIPTGLRFVGYLLREIWIGNNF